MTALRRAKLTRRLGCDISKDVLRRAQEACKLLVLDPPPSALPGLRSEGAQRPASGKRFRRAGDPRRAGLTPVTQRLMIEVALEMLTGAILEEDIEVLARLRSRGRGAKYRETFFREPLDKRGRT